MTGMAYSDMYVLLFNDFGNNSGAAPVSDRYQMGIHRLAMRVQDLLARTFLMSWGKCVVVLAKKPLAAPLRERLEAAGFRRHLLPRIPICRRTRARRVGSGAAAPLPQ